SLIPSVVSRYGSAAAVSMAMADLLPAGRGASDPVRDHRSGSGEGQEVEPISVTCLGPGGEPFLQLGPRGDPRPSVDGATGQGGRRVRVADRFRERQPAVDGDEQRAVEDVAGSERAHHLDLEAG